MISTSQQWMITAAEAALKLILDIENLITLLMKLIQSILDLSSGRLTSILVKSFQINLNPARARRACALRALGLLLVDGVLTVGWGKTFWRVGRFPTRKRA